MSFSCFVPLSHAFLKSSWTFEVYCPETDLFKDKDPETQSRFLRIFKDRDPPSTDGRRRMTHYNNSNIRCITRNEYYLCDVASRGLRQRLSRVVLPIEKPYRGLSKYNGLIEVFVA